jgi:glycosyltransferase involved in cell wall biosynthesis
MNLSVTIITFNEELNIARAIESAQFADEVIVVDSGSSDKTCEIARHMGAKVITHLFEGYGQQKNFAAQQAQGKWILNIDADEVISPELKSSVESVLRSKGPSYQIYQMKRRNHFCGHAIYGGGWYPDTNARLYQSGKATWTTPKVHERLLSIDTANPSIGDLEGDILHFSFPTLLSQITTNVRYAQLGAEELLKRPPQVPVTFIKVVFRPFGKFLECYFLKQGFKDGKWGFIIAINAAYSLFIKYALAYTREVTARYSADHKSERDTPSSMEK